jgi:hypothetical protein
LFANKDKGKEWLMNKGLGRKVLGNFIAKTGFKHLNSKSNTIVKRSRGANAVADNYGLSNAKYRKATIVFEMKAFKIRVFTVATF